MKLNGIALARPDLAARIDHTVLSPAATEQEVAESCALAVKHGFRAVFTNPYWSAFVAERLEGTGVMTGVSAAFPLGALPSRAKAAEVAAVLEEIGTRPVSVDVVANTGLLKQGLHAAYTEDLRAVASVAAAHGAECKVIIETALLGDEEIRVAAACAVEAGAAFVKTSTGRNGPPRLRDIAIMRAAMPPGAGIKFSGFGTHNGPEIAAMALAMGADLLGTPQGDVLLEALCGDYADMDITAA